MGGCRCSYKNCPNTTTTTENIHFFHYPVKHKERCRIWIENANKLHFCDIEEEQLRNKSICEVHFEDKWFLNSQRKRLLQGAIPTLDGDCIEEKPTESDMFVFNGLQEVQILPASSDGSLFILDTDSNRPHSVESFIYKNGVIVPSDGSVKEDVMKSKLSNPQPSTSGINIFSENSSFNVSNSTRFQNSTNIQKEPKTIIKADFDNGDTDVKYENDTENDNAPSENIIYVESDNLSKRKSPRIANAKGASPPSKGTIDKPHLGTNYLKKIKQHSRDIACIKKMLRQKVRAQNKPDTDTILATLKKELPATLFSVVNLNLNEKYELTQEDEEFFTDIHKTSPQLYQLLVDKYKWNLPCIDTTVELEDN
ncbi:unnamed protein product [Phyllotreta striolata]|uniref:THAP-type domain-containing protein n=1 Tax=Phyllotreta striolata TaxID=444603 RepID=A0A9N9XJW0_PHYSR|nr:unnamed protein product [Phyllotreta striolata]